MIANERCDFRKPSLAWGLQCLVEHQHVIRVQPQTFCSFRDLLQNCLEIVFVAGVRFRAQFQARLQKVCER